MTYYRQLSKQKSAVKCLFGSLCFTGGGSTIFIIAFFRQYFSVSLESIVTINLVATIIIICGSLSTGLFGGLLSVKSLAVMGSFISGVLLLVLFCAPNVEVALACYFSAVWFLGLTVSSSICLLLDQFPTSQSTIMSLFRFFSALNGLIVPAIGGLLLVLFSTQSNWGGYQFIGIMLSLMNILASIFFLKTKS